MTALPRKSPVPWRLVPKARKTVLLVHIITAIGWMGVDIAVLALLMTARTTDDATLVASAFNAIGLIVPLTVPPLSLGILATGLLLGLGTPWGVLRYWWVLVKLALSLLMTVLVFTSLVSGVNALGVLELSSVSADTLRSSLGSLPTDLMFPPVVSFLMLGFAAALSVVKPWRLTPWSRPPLPKNSALGLDLSGSSHVRAVCSRHTYAVRETAMTRKYDLYSQDFKRESYPTFARMREHDPILKQAGLDEQTDIWFFTRYEDVEAILRDKRFVRDERQVTGWQPSGFEALLEGHMLNRDGADHQRLRGLVSQAFTPKRIRDLRPRIEALANELIDAVEAQGQMDLMADFAFHLPTIVILELLGVPSRDRETFKAWSNALIAPTFSEAEGAQAVAHLQAFIAYLRELFTARRKEPQDDLVSALLQAEAQGDRLSEAELFGTFVLLIVAGHETTVNLIGNSMLALWRNPEQLGKLRADPSLMPQAVEEFLRYDGSVERALSRWAAEDFDYKSHALRRGDPVILILGAANHDPAVFENPEMLELTREPNPHLGFGKGPHYCLGATLARLETTIALNTLLARLPELRPDMPLEEVRYRMLPGFRGLESLPVVWD